MGESAALLAKPGQSVHLPAWDANCMMSLMTPAGLARTVLLQLQATGRRVVPLAYVNTPPLALKAVVGEFGGAVCTSANARTMLAWALKKLARRRRALSARQAPGPQHGPAAGPGPRGLACAAPEREKGAGRQRTPARHAPPPAAACCSGRAAAPSTAACARKRAGRPGRPSRLPRAGPSRMPS